jgi:hypothetical protein
VEISSKGMALIKLCLLTFSLSRTQTRLWKSLFLSEWCRLMVAIATNCKGEKMQHAVDNIIWFLVHVDQFEDTETPGLSFFVPVHSAFYSALLSSKESSITCGRVGSFATSLFARLFLVLERVKRQVVERVSRPFLESAWRSSTSLISKEKKSLQATP